MLWGMNTGIIQQNFNGRSQSTEQQPMHRATNHLSSFAARYAFSSVFCLRFARGSQVVSSSAYPSHLIRNSHRPPAPLRCSRTVSTWKVSTSLVPVDSAAAQSQRGMRCSSTALSSRTQRWQAMGCGRQWGSKHTFVLAVLGIFTLAVLAVLVF